MIVGPGPGPGPGPEGARARAPSPSPASQPDSEARCGPGLTHYESVLLEAGLQSSSLDTQCIDSNLESRDWEYVHRVGYVVHVTAVPLPWYRTVGTSR